MPDRDDARPTLSAFDIGCVVVGGIVGVGIFFTPAQVAKSVDGAELVVVAWVLGGLMAMLGALMFAELSARVPGHGGMFTYIHEAFGAVPSFVYGWSNWLVIQAGALAVVSLVMVDYAEELVLGTRAADPDTKVWIATAAILFFTLVNAAGLRVGRGVQNALTVLKLVAVFLLVVLGLLAVGRDIESDDASNVESRGVVAGLAAAMLPVLFSFGGWQQGSFVAGAARRRSDVARGIVVGVAVVVVAYLGVNLAFLSLLGFDGARASNAIGADAARVALEPLGFGDAGARVLAGMVVLSALGIMNTICLAPPYVLHAMAERGLFFESVGRIHPTLHAPVLGVLVQGTWAMALCAGGHFVLGLDLGFLLDGVVFVDWLFFALCGAALLRLRSRGGGGDGFRLRGGGVLAVLFTALAVAVAAGAVATSPKASLAGLSVCGAGLVVLAVVRRGRRRGENGRMP